ncbi:hypothetical protein ONV78_16385 [Hahella sp. CR1]|uniref:hypothetical protein n=1 Tax=Hahella sp. CR1 TaxID=2992807 RepID=UPI00244180D6|nr:hypothetical protein [Hahella sp. CR1]MDG9669319.1 hypothetical protein [Hahella sp. CR1]
MKINGYILAAAILIIAVFLSYFLHFYVSLGYEVSNDSAIWGQLGDYSGGILNPLLSFVSIVLLIRSLNLQNEANLSLRTEIENSEKTERLRSFESLFFNLINSQKNLFDTFSITTLSGEAKTQIDGVKAVMKIEDEIEKIRENDGKDEEVKKYIEALDENDQIFGLARAFYVTVLMVSEKLSESEGFSLGDRRDHFMTLINFTDFAQLRLVMICVQFLDYESCKYIRLSSEFEKVIEDVGLSYELY